jgi:hypothetical protein
MTKGPTDLKPAKDLRACEVFFYNDQRFLAISGAVYKSISWIVNAQDHHGKTIRFDFAENDEVGVGI